MSRWWVCDVTRSVKIRNVSCVSGTYDSAGSAGGGEVDILASGAVGIKALLST